MITSKEAQRLYEILNGMMTERYTCNDSYAMLLATGISNSSTANITRLITSTLNRISELTALADKADEPHLDHMYVTWLLDLAYEHDLIDDEQAHSVLMRDGFTHEAAHHHLIATREIRDRDASRAEYLDHPDTAKRFCTVCGRQTVADNLSNRGLCQNCAAEIGTAVTFQLIRKSGPYYRQWRTGMMAYAYELEDEEIAEQHAIRDAEPPRKLSDYIEEPQHECDDDCDSDTAEYDDTCTEHDDTYAGETGDDSPF